MNKILSLILTLSLVACMPSKQVKQDDTTQMSQPDSKVFTQPYEMRELDNGLKVIVVKTDYPGVVSLQIPVQTGSRNEV